MNKISILEDVVKQVESEPDLEKAKKLVLDKVNQSKIREEDKQTIRSATSEAYNKSKLTENLWNLILAYHGLKTIKR